MELDTGASVSIISEYEYRKKFGEIKLETDGLKLQYYTNETVDTLGHIQVNIKYKNKKFKGKWYVLKGQGPMLLGREWLKEMGTLSDLCINNSIKKTLLNKPLLNIDLNNIDNAIVDKFPEVFSNELGLYKGEEIELVLVDSAKPKFFQPRTIPLVLKSKVEAELNRLEKDGIISKVKYSMWGTPIVLIIKPSGDIRICGDYKVTLNPFLKQERAIVPRIEELLVGIKTKGKFSIIDLSQAYLQLSLDSKSRELTAISTHMGVYVYNRVPFGINASVGIFLNRFGERLKHIPNIRVYFDEILIFGDSEKEHLETLIEVLKVIKSLGLTVWKEKCLLFKDEIKFLGYIINSSGSKQDAEKIKAIKFIPYPKDKTQLQAFLGSINYYRQYIPNLSTIQVPLSNLLKKEMKFNFNKNCCLAFDKIKSEIISDRIFKHFDPNKITILTCDASAYGVGAVLSQVDNDNKEYPVAFASKTLNVAEKNYSQVDKEALAIIFGINKFNNFLWGRQFTIRCD